MRQTLGRRLPSSIRWKFATATTLLILFSVAICVGGATLFLRQSLTDRAHAELQRNLAGVQAYLKTERSDLLGTAQLIASDNTVRSDLSARRRRQMILRLIPYYADLNVDVMDIVDSSGRVYIRMENLVAQGDRRASQTNVRAALAGRSVTGVEYDQPVPGSPGAYALSATVPISLARGGGVLVLGRQIDTLLARDIGHAVDADVNLVVGNQRIGTTLTDAHGLPVTGIPEPASVLRRIASGKVSIANASESGPVISGIVPLRSADGKPLGAVEVVSKLDPVYALVVQLSWVLVALGAAVVLLGVGLALAMAGRLTGRLSGLETAAATIADRVEQDLPLDEQALQVHVTGTDEVASLAASVRAMTVALDERMKVNQRLFAESQRRARDRLQATEVQYEGIFEATGDGLIIGDLEGMVVEANPAACEMLGYGRDELIGMDLADTVRDADQRVLAGFAGSVRAGDRFEGNVVSLRKDGSSFSADVHGTPFLFRGVPHVLIVSRDVTEQVEAYQMLEQRVAERTKEIRTMLDVSHNVAATLELRPLLGLLLEGLSEVLEYDGAAISTVDDQGLKIAEYRGPVTAAATGDMERSLEALAERETVRAGEPIIIDDTRDGSDWATFFRESIGAGLDSNFSHVRSFMAVPLMLGDRFTGLLTLAHRQPGYYSTEQLRLASAMADQAVVAIENARLYEQAQHVAAHEERSRLARELHDSVTQALFSMTLHARAAQMAARNAKVDPEGAVASNLEQLSQLTQAALAEMRALIFELRPDALQEEGLAAALRKHAAALSARSGTTIEVQAPDGRIGLAPATEEHLYGIAREALHNAVKHSGSETVCVQLTVEGTMLRLTVSDRGGGFDASISRPGHLGMKTMRERARMLGGELTVESSSGQGTTIRVTVLHGVEQDAEDLVVGAGA